MTLPIIVAGDNTYRCSRCNGTIVFGATFSPQQAEASRKAMGWRIRLGRLVCPQCAKRSRLRDRES